MMTSRRGLGICAIGAVDMALWDLCGKIYEQPTWKLLGGSTKEYIYPYASLLPEGDNFTVGGCLAGLGLGSSSYIYGFFNDNVIDFDIIPVSYTHLTLPTKRIV